MSYGIYSSITKLCVVHLTIYSSVNIIIPQFFLLLLFYYLINNNGIDKVNSSKKFI